MSLFKSLKPSINSDNLRSHLSWFSQVRRDTGGTGEEAAVDDRGKGRVEPAAHGADCRD